MAQTNESGDLDFSAIHKVESLLWPPLKGLLSGEKPLQQGAGDRKVWGDATDLMEIIPTEEDLLKPEEDEVCL